MAKLINQKTSYTVNYFLKKDCKTIVLMNTWSENSQTNSPKNTQFSHYSFFHNLPLVVLFLNVVSHHLLFLGLKWS